MAPTNYRLNIKITYNLMDLNMMKFLYKDLQLNPLKTNRALIFFSLLIFFCISYVLPIILADRLYIDDILRSQTGMTRWWVNARPLADYVMELMNFNGDNIVDVSPLNLLISVLVFSYFAFLYFDRNMGSFSPVTSAIMMFFVIANPFMLENLSYKFDILPMMISISILFLPFTFTENRYFSILLSIACIVSSLCLYQASLGFFVCLSIIEFTKNSCNNVNVKTYTSWFSVLKRVIELSIAYLIYSNIAKNYIFGDYNLKHSQSIDINSDGIRILLHNAGIYLEKINLYLSEVKYISLLLLIGTILFIAKSTIKNFNKGNNKVNVLATLIVLIVSTFSITLFSFIHLSLLKNPVFADRTLISFGGVTLFFSWCYFSLTQNKIYTCIISIPLILFCFVYSYAYGNALKHQKNYDNMLSSSIADKISSIDPSAKKIVLFYGNQPTSKQRENAVKRFPSLNSLVPVYYTGGWWGTQLIKTYGVSNLVKGADSLGIACKMKKEFENQTYQVYSDIDNLLITFENPTCN